ncbi:MFS transporter [Cysteiniphilum halobium]|uniref:MFS transporter n=1 Tax=Cysteiniphilum halobium TaxID=2219059 RepID=UPI000E6588CF|nr:MFS transporter [Cysteiniphilum halobium]
MSYKHEKKAVIAIAASNYLEAGAIVAGAGGLSLWVKYLHLTDWWVGLLGALSANGFGAAIGAIIGGYFIDHFGRKFIYKYDLLIYMLGILMITIAHSFLILLLGYIIVGIAVGALIPAAWTYIAEEAPPEKRAARVGWSQFAWSMGPAITLFLSTILAPLGILGSRIIFAQLFIVALFTWILQQQIRESQIWEQETKKQSHDHNGLKIMISNMKEMFMQRVNLKAFLFLIGIYFFWNLVAGTMGYFMPYIYERVGGLTNTMANLVQGVLWTFTVISTYFVFIRLGDKVNRKVLFGISSIMNIIAWVILSYWGMGLTELLIFIILWGVAAGFSAQAFYALFASELFHTKYRAQAQGLMFCIVRAGVGVISLVIPLMISHFGFTVSGTIMIIFLLISMIFGLLMIPNTQGRSLRSLEQERYEKNS